MILNNATLVPALDKKEACKENRPLVQVGSAQEKTCQAWKACVNRYPITRGGQKERTEPNKQPRIKQ